MRAERRTATGKGGRQEAPRKGSEGDGSDGSGAIQLGTRRVYDCPCCGDEANATYTDRYTPGFPEWLIGCWTAGCAGRVLPSLAEAFGLDPGATKHEIATHVAQIGRTSSRRDERLPSRREVTWRKQDLWSLAGVDARRWLRRERGVAPAVVRVARIGWDRSQRRLIFPMFSGGELVAAKWRAPRSGAQMRSWAGSDRPWPLYPEPDPRSGWALLVAGELDALRGRSAGLPAVSVTLGAGRPSEINGTPVAPASGPGTPWWRDEWTDALRGLRVVVVFDNNEQAQARECVRRLRGEGVDADGLDLRALGLDTPKGDLSDYLNGGGDEDALRPAEWRAAA